LGFYSAAPQRFGKSIESLQGLVMENKFISDVNKLTVILALCAFFVVGWTSSFLDGTGILLCAAWGLLNLYIIKKFLTEWLLLQTRNCPKFYTLLFIKFPLLYGMGYFLLRLDLFSPMIAAVGFSLLLLAIFMLGFFHFFHDQSKASTSSNL
jgi:hypothetical protein